MRKESYIAIIIGISIGLLIAFGILRANRALQNKDLISTEVTPTTKTERPTPPPGVLSISLVRPENFSVTSSQSLTYSGVTKPGSILVISSETKDFITKAPDNGSFEMSIEFVGGLNQVLLSSFDEAKTEVKEKSIIVYSTEFKDNSDENKETNPDTLKERIESVKSSPKVFMGTITDKTDNSLQIKNFEGTIQIIAITKDASFAQGLTVPKDLKYSDIAIGDYIIAMGFENTKGVLTTQRVVVSKPFTEPTRKILYGKILSINKKVVTIEDKNNIVWVLSLPIKWAGPDVKDLTVGQNLIAVGEPEIDKPENIKVRTISLEPDVKNTPALSPTPTLKVSPTTKPKTSPTPKI